MNQVRNQGGKGRIAAGCLLGALLASISPWTLVTEIFSSLPLILLPALGLVFIHNWAGRGACVFSGFLMLVSFGLMLGTKSMWVIYLLMINPLVLLLRETHKPFFAQLRTNLISFGMGLGMAVLLLYISYGGNLIERMFGLLMDSVRRLPSEVIETAVSALPSNAGMPVDAQGFLELTDRVFASLIPDFNIYLPGKLFSGMLLTSLSCTVLANRMRAKAGLAPKGSYVPVAKWYLPASVTGGMLMLLAAGTVMVLADMQGAQAVFQAVLEIASWTFTVQTISSLSRRIGRAQNGQRPKMLILACVFAICLLGGGLFIAAYGFASAVMGEKGALRQLAQQHKYDNDSPDNRDE